MNQRRLVPREPAAFRFLEMVKTDPAGEPHTAMAFVFGTVIGEQVKSPKKTWATVVLKAHGHTPAWKGTTLDADSRARLRVIDLHFHDLRHEAGSRLLIRAGRCSTCRRCWATPTRRRRASI